MGYITNNMVMLQATLSKIGFEPYACVFPIIFNDGSATNVRSSAQAQVA